MSILDIRHLSVTYYGADTPTLADVNLTLREQDFVVALGASGCGKTSLLNCMAGFLRPSSGSLTFDGAPIEGPDVQRGVVFQKHALFPWFNVVDNVAVPLRLKGLSKAEQHRIALEKLEMVGLEGQANRQVWELSGGMQQRVGIARALASDPSLLLLDEPLGALDAFTRETLQEQLLRVWSQARKMVFFITHSVEEALFLATRLVIMAPNPGRIVRTYEDLPYSREFLQGVSTRTIKSRPDFIALREEVLGLIHAQGAKESYV